MEFIELKSEQIARPSKIPYLKDLARNFTFQFANSNSDKYARAYTKIVSDRFQLHIKYGKTREFIFVLREAKESEIEYQEKTNIVAKPPTWEVKSI